MANRARVLAISLIFVIMMFSQGLNAQEVPELDKSKVGVKDGDNFTYQVVWNSWFNPEFDRLTTWNQEAGSEFTVNIMNATPIYEKSWDITIPDRNYLLTEIVFENGTVQQEESLDHFGGWIVFPDWEYWEFVENETVNWVLSSENNMTIKLDNQIINGPEVFIHRYSINTTAPDIVYGGNYTSYSFNEIKYDKATGTLLYLVSVFDYTTQDGRQIQYWEVAYIQKGYEDYELPPNVADQEETSSTDDSTSSSLTSSFSLIAGFTTLIAIFTVIRYRKH